MFQKLHDHSQILVSGPQRSGTRIAATMIANDTGHRFIDETEVKELFLGQSLEDRNRNKDWNVTSAKIIAVVQKLIDENTNFVLHCPPFMPWLHLVNGAFIVVMRRSIADIMKSANRIGWKRGRYEFEYNKMGYTRFGRHKIGLTKTDEHIATIKYDYWDSYQKGKIANHQEILDNTSQGLKYTEIDYESLSNHSLWVPPLDRFHFRWNQTKIR